MSIVLVGSTSGSITLQEPAVAGTTVLDLPAVSGTFITTTGGVAPSTSGNVLTSDGTSWTSAPAGGVTAQNCSYTGSLVESGSIPFTATTTADLGSNRVVTGMTFDKSPCGVSFSSLKLRGYNIKNTA